MQPHFTEQPGLTINPANRTVRGHTPKRARGRNRGRREVVVEVRAITDPEPVDAKVPGCYRVRLDRAVPLNEAANTAAGIVTRRLNIRVIESFTFEVRWSNTVLYVTDPMCLASEERLPGLLIGRASR